ncbi:spore germination protein GerPC [Bacillus sp. D-CC]
MVEGTKQGLHEDLSLALTEGRKPLDIINGPLMTGMDEVGRLFNNNELIVAEVLQSAESMKAAVSYLEPHMESSDSAKKGKVLLATVKGDVHDIGKNLVEIILANNGYEIINLGINVRSDRILHFEQEERTPLDEMYRQMMVDDIKKQMEHRLPYYLSQAQSHEGISTDPDYLRDIIIQAMKHDIDKAFLSFIQHIPGNFRKE